ncbi:hypothetical protein D8674_039714 [Pyrus ussuriensis x Pyrus communis]|uniref:Uncharacterized protein n=1 Tax=Pyrus ussuriensis x Pyrus communis TaxID=2448454 RepID=A0A5N5F895_9ROSA|nr:hypothetical protein D8674_039714 [Pyrus ussuriensis x Pyrus communis]
MAGEDPERDFNKKTVMAKPGLCPRGLRRRRSIPTDGFVNLNQIHDGMVEAEMAGQWEEDGYDGSREEPGAEGCKGCIEGEVAHGFRGLEQICSPR